MSLNPADTAFETVLRQRLPKTCFRPQSPHYQTEPRGFFQGQAGLVLAPGSTAEAAEVVRQCAEAGVGIVPYGGGTGLVGGQVMEQGARPVILSLERLKRIRDINPVDNVLLAEAGVVLADIRAAADGVGRLFPLSLASEGSCQIGGNLATNAGGVGVLRYGNARDLCLGLEVVLPDGSIWNGLGRLRKDNTGYDLKNLLIGAEGSLGLITAASLKLFHRPDQQLTAFLQVTSPEAALSVLAMCQSHLGGMVSACELIHRQGFDFLKETMPQIRLPFAEPGQWMLLVEIDAVADSGADTRFELVLGQAMERGLAQDALIAQNETQRQAYWAVRESIPEANRRIGAIYSHDISVPISRIPELIDKGAGLIAALGDFRINCFGHLGDGNLHYNIYPPKGRDRDAFSAQRDSIKHAIYDLVYRLGGSMSAEHGIGRLKLDDLVRYGSAEKLAMMRAIKQALDPKGIMNPGAVVPP